MEKRDAMVYVEKNVTWKVQCPMWSQREHKNSYKKDKENKVKWIVMSKTLLRHEEIGGRETINQNEDVMSLDTMSIQ